MEIKRISYLIEETERDINNIAESIVDMELAGYEDNKSQILYRKLRKKKAILKSKLSIYKKFQKIIEEEVLKGYNRARQEVTHAIEEIVREIQDSYFKTFKEEMDYDDAKCNALRRLEDKLRL